MGGVRVNGLLCVGRCVDESELEVSVCVRQRDVKRTKSPSRGHSESCKAPTRPLSAKVWVARNGGRWCDRRLRSFDTAVAGQQRNQQSVMARDLDPAASTTAQPPALSKSLDIHYYHARPRSVQTPMLGLTIYRRRDLSRLV